MLAGDFQRKIKKLNPQLHIFCGNDDRKGAGLFRIAKGEYEAIIGVDKSFVPEWTIYDDYGHIVKSGWRRVVKNLIKRRLVNRHKAEQVFKFEYVSWRQGELPPTRRDPICDYIDDCLVNAPRTQVGDPLMKKNDIMDLSKEITKNAG